MAISVAVTKDLSGIKKKVAMNLTKRQICCFSAAAGVGIPFYFATKEGLGIELAAIGMVVLMLPFFFLAMYERDGFPAEKIIYFVMRQKFFTPGIRPYQTENLYRSLEERERLREELLELERKEKGIKRKVGEKQKGRMVKRIRQ